MAYSIPLALCSLYKTMHEQNEEKRKCSLKQAVIGLSCKPFLMDDP